MPKLNVPTEQQLRQAVASLGGYAYQLYLSALEWERLAAGGELHLEVAEDFATLANGVLTMSQAKREAGSGSVTLRSPGARDAIGSLWQFQNANPGMDVRLVYLTTAMHGREQEFRAGLRDGGIERWRAAAAGEDQPELRKLLLALNLPDDLTAFLRTASGSELRSRLFERISWACEAPSLEQVRDRLSGRLVERAAARGLLASDGENATAVMVEAVLRSIAIGERVLTPADFERTFEQATSISVSRTLARKMTAHDRTEARIGTAPEAPRHLVVRAGPYEDAVTALCRDGRVAMTGIGGSGKSTLAAQMAGDRRVRECFPDGVLWASIGPGGKAALHLENWIRLLGGTPPRTDDEEVLATAWRAALGDRRLLIVADDLWRLDRVERLMPSSGCGFIATGRLPRLAAMIGAVEVEIGGLEQEEAVRLLRNVSGDVVAPSARFDGLIARLHGLALPLVLVGSLLRDGAVPEEILAQLAHEELRLSAIDLDDGSHGGEDAERRNVSVEACLGLGVRALGARHRAAFLRLAVLPEGVELDAALARPVMAVDDAVEASRLLEDLVGRGLMSRTGSGTGMQRSYRLHDLLLDYARTAFGPGRKRIAPTPDGLPPTMAALHGELLDRILHASATGGWADVDGTLHFDLHLGWHMVKAARPHLLHALIQETDGAGGPAWRGRLRRNNRSAAFLGDLARSLGAACADVASNGGERDMDGAVVAAAAACTAFAAEAERASVTPVGLLPVMVGAGLVAVEEAITRATLASGAIDCWLLGEMLPIAPPSARRGTWSAFLTEALRGHEFAMIGDEDLLALVLPSLLPEEWVELVAVLPDTPVIVQARVIAEMHRSDPDRAGPPLRAFLERRPDERERSAWNAGVVHMAVAGVPTGFSVAQLIALLKHCGPYEREARSIFLLVDETQLAAVVRGGDTRTVAHVLDPFERSARALPSTVLVDAISVLERESDAPARALLMARLTASAGDAGSPELAVRTLDLLLALQDGDWRKADGLGGILPSLPETRRRQAEAAFVRSGAAVGFGTLGSMRLRRIAEGLGAEAMADVADALVNGSPFDRQVTLPALLEHAPDLLVERIAGDIVAEAKRSGKVGDVHRAAHRLPADLLPSLQEGIRRLPIPDFVDAIRSLMRVGEQLPLRLTCWIDEAWSDLDADARLRMAMHRNGYAGAEQAVDDIACCLLGRGDPVRDAAAALEVAPNVLALFEPDEVRKAMGPRIGRHLASGTSDHAVSGAAAFAMYFEQCDLDLLVTRTLSLTDAGPAAHALAMLARAMPSRRRELVGRAAAMVADAGDASSAAYWVLAADDLLDDASVAPLLGLRDGTIDQSRHAVLSTALYRFLPRGEQEQLPTRLIGLKPLAGLFLDRIDRAAYPDDMLAAFDVSRFGRRLSSGADLREAFSGAGRFLAEDAVVAAAILEDRPAKERMLTCIDLMRSAMAVDVRTLSRVTCRIAPVLQGALGGEVCRRIAETMSRTAVLYSNSCAPDTR